MKSIIYLHLPSIFLSRPIMIRKKRNMCAKNLFWTNSQDDLQKKRTVRIHTWIHIYNLQQQLFIYRNSTLHCRLLYSLHYDCMHNFPLFFIFIFSRYICYLFHDIYTFLFTWDNVLAQPSLIFTQLYFIVVWYSYMSLVLVEWKRGWAVLKISDIFYFHTVHLIDANLSSYH